MANVLEGAVKVQAALLTPDEVEKLAQAATLVADGLAANTNQYYPGRDKFEQASKLLADVLRAK